MSAPKNLYEVWLTEEQLAYCQEVYSEGATLSACVPARRILYEIGKAYPPPFQPKFGDWVSIDEGQFRHRYCGTFRMRGKIFVLLKDNSNGSLFHTSSKLIDASNDDDWDDFQMKCKS